MRIPGQRKNKTIAQQTKRLLCLLLLLFAVYILGSFFLLDRMSGQMLQKLDQMAELYTNELDNRFLRISRKLFSTMMERSRSSSIFWNYMESYLTGEQNEEYLLMQLREHYLSSAWEYGEEYQIFLYLDRTKKCYALSISPDGKYEIPDEMQEVVKEQIQKRSDMAYSVKKKWDIITYGTETYMCKIAQNGGVYMGCYVNVNDILAPFSQLTLADNGFVRLVDDEGEVVGMITDGDLADPAGEGLHFQFDRSHLLLKDLSRAPFQIQISVSDARLMVDLKGVGLVLAVIAVILIGIELLLLFYLLQNLLKPIQQFTNNLLKYDEGDLTFQLTEGNLQELEQIDDKFRTMLHQIRRLKITLYEQELEKQKVEMDFLRLQIRPHFYLNCLNFIYSMIDFGQYENAQAMSRITADYLTYIFRNTSELVPVSAEVEHCQNYLKILLLRYPARFEYYVEVQEEVADTAIFPFLLQVFVENAAKHALTLEEKILISVTVYPEDLEDGKYVNLYISDTGSGFPAPMLEKLRRGEIISEDGQHLGIANCLKRFQYYYKDKGYIHFENSPLGGAIVDIHIPYESNVNNLGNSAE